SDLVFSAPSPSLCAMRRFLRVFYEHVEAEKLPLRTPHKTAPPLDNPRVFLYNKVERILEKTKNNIERRTPMEKERTIKRGGVLLLRIFGG
ncbi:MAG: hypothetical protein II325_04040, partial [Clostridia bacterium]|nr:hypothetical protein [Clostridia bacterium]